MILKILKGYLKIIEGNLKSGNFSYEFYLLIYLKEN